MPPYFNTVERLWIRKSCHLSRWAIHNWERSSYTHVQGEFLLLLCNLSPRQVSNTIEFREAQIWYPLTVDCQTRWRGDCVILCCIVGEEATGKNILCPSNISNVQWASQFRSWPQSSIVTKQILLSGLPLILVFLIVVFATCNQTAF